MVTGVSDPAQAAARVLGFPDSCTRWCIIKLGERGAALYPRGGVPVWTPAFQVLVEFVGCQRSRSCQLPCTLIRFTGPIASNWP